MTRTNVVLADYNQRIPGNRYDSVAASVLLAKALTGFAALSSGQVDGNGKGLIDHISVYGLLWTFG